MGKKREKRCCMVADGNADVVFLPALKFCPLACYFGLSGLMREKMPWPRAVCRPAAPMCTGIRNLP